MGNEELFVVDKIDGNRDNIPTNKVSKIYICYSNIRSSYKSKFQ